MSGLIFSAILYSLFLVPDGASQSDISGYWLNDAGDVIVRIYKCDDGTMAGDVVWTLDSLDPYGEPIRDVMNHKPQLRSRLVKGITVLSDFEWSYDAWRSGTYYNFQTGNDYEIKISLDKAGNLRLTGYYGLLFFLGKTKVWTPVADKNLYGLK